MASRILGMGDVLSLVEEVHRKVDQHEAEKLVKKIRRGRGFDLGDFKSQLEQMQNIGGLSGLVDKLPGMSGLPDQVKSQVDDRQTGQMIAIINSMTPQERRFPDVIRGSRKKRIAMGSGTQIQAVNRLLKQHTQMQRMMKKMGKGGMAGMMRKLGKLEGQISPGKIPGGKMRF
jgi:signal recognition particle subunit SRP54